jgi:hypothetical protein
MNLFKKYRPYALFTINKEKYVLIQIGIASWVLIDAEKNLLNSGMYGDQANYMTHKELTKLAGTNEIKFDGYLVFSPLIDAIQIDIFRMLRKDDDTYKLKEGLRWAMTEMRNLGVTESQEEVYTKMEKLLK